MDKTFWTTAGGGLGNRVGGLLLGYSFARHFTSPLHSSWVRKNPGCCAEWDDLFIPPQDRIIFYPRMAMSTTPPEIARPTPIEARPADLFFTHHVRGRMEERLQAARDGTCEICYHRDMDFSTICNKIAAMPDGSKIAFGDNNFNRRLVSTKIRIDFFTRALVPKPEILYEVENFCLRNKINKDNTIGCHIRATDRLQDWDGTIERAVQRVQKVFRHHGDKKIFVCSDSKEMEDAVCSRFPENVLRYPKSEYVKKYDESKAWGDKIPFYNVLRSKQSVVEALIDCLILSRTNLRQFTSIGSFITMAREFSVRWDV